MDRRLLAAFFGPGSRLAFEAELPDAELLARFAAGADGYDAAFAEVVRRHGPLVWGVCRRLLSEPADTEDAFQATFLALVQSPRAVRRSGSLPGWLYGVAVRVSTKLKRTAVRGRQRDGRAAVPEASCPVPDSAWEAAYAALQDEVQRLPAVLRTAFLVCDIGNTPQPEAAKQLGWKPGTLSGRLAKARQRLAAALTARGLAPAVAAGVLAATAGDGDAVPWRVIEAVHGFVLTPATGAVPAAILALAGEGVIVGISRLKLAALATVAAGGVSMTAAPVLIPAAVGQGPGSGPAVATAPPADAAPPPALPAAEAPKPKPPAGPGWEYEFADLPKELPTIQKLLTEKGQQGWEFAGTAAGQDARSSKVALTKQGLVDSQYVVTVEVAVFKRPAGGPRAAAPVVNTVPPDGVRSPDADPLAVRLQVPGRTADAIAQIADAALAKTESPATGRGAVVTLLPYSGPPAHVMMQGASTSQDEAVRSAIAKAGGEVRGPYPDLHTPRVAVAAPTVAVETGNRVVYSADARPAAAAPVVLATKTSPADLPDLVNLVAATLGDQSSERGGPVEVRPFGGKLVLIGADAATVAKVTKFLAEIEADGPSK